MESERPDYYDWARFYSYENTMLYKGIGNGTFEDPVVIRDFPDSRLVHNFAIPQRICKRFPISSD